MPQASQETRDEFTSHFGEGAEPFDAEEHLKSAGYVIKGGRISHPQRGVSETNKTAAAINYLCDEWDYAFKETP